MPKFPKAQADIIALAESLKTGLRGNTTTYPAPPEPWMALGHKIAGLVNTRNDCIAAAAEAEQAVKDKDIALTALIAAMKTDLRYAENVTDNDDAKLNLIGWGAKASPKALTPPGQALYLKATTQGEGTITLQWQTPIACPSSGKVQAYKIVRQIDDGTVADVATAVDTTAELIDQPLRKKLQYTIIAINKAGMGMPSNTVEVVL